MDFNELLKEALKYQASDVHLKVGIPPLFRVFGTLVVYNNFGKLTKEFLGQVAVSIMNNNQKELFKKNFQVDLSYSLPAFCRFRVNIFMQRGNIGMVLRAIPYNVKTITDLKLPEVLKTIAMTKRGLVLVTGATGSGKSTTLAAMIDYINENDTRHIITIEDPIEFMIRDKKCLVNQREIGLDAISFAHALKSSLRQDPDVILIGEMRDLETMEIALQAAETGHMVFSTLHTINSVESINRIISSFPPSQQNQIRHQLASVLTAVISQRLIPLADKKGRVPAVELLRNTARIKEIIDGGQKDDLILEAIQSGYDVYKMQSFDQSLMHLLKNKWITFEDALAESSNPDNFQLRLKGVSSAGGGIWEQFEKKNDLKADTSTEKDFIIEKF